MKLLHITLSVLLLLLSSCGGNTVDGQADVEGDDDKVTEHDADIGSVSDTDIPEDTDNDSVHGDSVDEPNDDDVSEQLPVVEPEQGKGIVAVIITTQQLAPPFRRLAALHTMLGIETGVVLLSDICASGCNDNDTKADTPKRIKEYLRGVPTLKYAMLGGDIDDVPSRKVHDTYSNTFAGSFTSDFYTDYYYSDLSVWDSNGDGVYAQDDKDNPDWRPDIAVSRIPVSSPEEADRYIEKVESYLSAYPPKAMMKIGLVANIATEYNGIVINAGYYFESPNRTVSLIPPQFSVEKLYAATVPKAAPDAQDLTLDAETALFTSGTNIIVHNGHGYPSLLTCEQKGNDLDFTGDMAYNLQNSVYPIFLSCACQAGEFEAPFTYHYTAGDGSERERVFPDDSAGERVITAPNGGAIAYLGNTTTGLGLAGGSQLIDEMVRYIFTVPSPILGDALFAGHMNLKENDTFQPPMIAIPIPVVDPDSYRWTQKSVVLLGDELIPVYTQPIDMQTQPLSVQVKKDVDGRVVTVSSSDCSVALFDGSRIFRLPMCDVSSCQFRLETDFDSFYGVRQCAGKQPLPFAATAQ